MVNNKGEQQMEKVQQFDRAVARDLNAALNAHLQEFAKKYGLNVAVRGASFSPTSSLVKVEFMTQGSEGRKQERKASALEVYAKLYLPGIDLEKSYSHPRLGTFKIIGWNTKAREYPVQVEAADGKRYKMAVEHVKPYIK
jgi:hypothetical protein